VLYTLAAGGFLMTLDSSVMNVSIATRRNARIDGLESALAILALLSIAALFYAQRIPATQARGAET